MQHDPCCQIHVCLSSLRVTSNLLQHSMIHSMQQDVQNRRMRGAAQQVVSVLCFSAVFPPLPLLPLMRRINSVFPSRVCPSISPSPHEDQPFFCGPGATRRGLAQRSTAQRRLPFSQCAAAKKRKHHFRAKHGSLQPSWLDSQGSKSASETRVTCLRPVQ